MSNTNRALDYRYNDDEKVVYLNQHAYDTCNKPNKRKKNITRKNKVCALALMLVGILSVLIDRDATFLIIDCMIAIPLFFAKKNIIQ